MSAEPSYLPLMRRIANAECNAEVYLSAWAAATPRADVHSVIATVALREGEHTKAFQKRIRELGFDVTIEEAPETASRTTIAAAADLTDREKFEELGLGGRPDPAVADRWAGYFEDTTIDIVTGELLGRFISEERDSVRLLADCYAALCAEDRPAAAPAAGGSRLARIEALLERLVERLDGAGPDAADPVMTGPVMTETAFRAGLRADGFDDEIRITTYAPGTAAGELHAHEFSARLYVLSGEFLLQDEHGCRALPAGSCCEVPAGTRHAEASGEAGARVLAGLKHP
ncbi:MAG: cupin domain-containing protein [Acidimicrobiales bacterium]